MVLAVVDDLLFRTKILAAADALGVLVRTVSQVPQTLDDPAGPPRLIIIDLHLTGTDPLRAIAAAKQLAPHAPILCFGSHVETALFDRAKAAGCTMAMPRSLFVQRLPDLLTEAPAPPA